MAIFFLRIPYPLSGSSHPRAPLESHLPPEDLYLAWWLQGGAGELKWPATSAVLSLEKLRFFWNQTKKTGLRYSQRPEEVPLISKDSREVIWHFFHFIPPKYRFPRDENDQKLSFSKNIHSKWVKNIAVFLWGLVFFLFQLLFFFGTKKIQNRPAINATARKGTLSQNGYGTRLRW